ncbi:MAG: DUF4274 domain-containing protein [Myxococcota bacterium]
MNTWLEDLDPADRGFLTWLSAVVRLPLDDLLQTIGVVAEADRIRELDLSPLGPHIADRPRPLDPPFAGLDGLRRLDCSGLQLPKLDLRSLGPLRHLRCADNALRELDVSAMSELESLDCSGNALMTLDLRGLGALRDVTCRENGLAMLLMDEAVTLHRLDASSNQLMVLDLGAQPVLHELWLARNALVSLKGSLPALEVLEASHNQLSRLDAAEWPALTTLSVAHNRLAALDVPPTILQLEVGHNYLAALNLAAASDLVHLAADHNQLVAVAWPRSNALVRVHVNGNRLSSLALGPGPTLVVTCDRNHLALLDTTELPALTKLSCTHNRLTLLDVRKNPNLVDLDLRNNPNLRTVDLTRNPWLTHLAVDAEGPRLIKADRALYDIAVPDDATPLEDLDTLSLHRAALAWWRSGRPEQLEAIVAHPRCDWGTAALLYWTHRPYRVRRDVDASALEPFEVPTWRLVQAIEARAQGDGFASRDCPFNPQHDTTTISVEGMDWTREGQADGVVVPPLLLEAIQPSGIGPQTRLPNATTSHRQETS